MLLQEKFILQSQDHNMMTVLEIINELKAFTNLSPSKKISYVSMGLVVLFGFLVVYFYKKHEKEFILLKEELVKKDLLYIKEQAKSDSLKVVIYNMKVEHINKDYLRVDSMLRESEKIRKSINPVIKKINSKINEINS